MVKKLFDLGPDLSIFPPTFGGDVTILPGDLSYFAPYGNAVYGYQYPENSVSNPITDAPDEDDRGGTVYFGCDITREEFTTLMHLLGVKSNHSTHPDQDYAVFVAESNNSEQENYIVQMRTVSRFGLRYMYNVLDETEYRAFPLQKLSLIDAFWHFIEHERKRWDTTWMKNEGLYGMFGGDGNMACEELCFGFLVENSYHHVYRIWSRAWLVTK